MDCSININWVKLVVGACLIYRLLREVLKPTEIVDLFISTFISVSFCFMHFDGLLLGATFLGLLHVLLEN